jgi:hypothetical protein
MVTQLLIAYGAGMVLVVGMEIAKVLKARSMSLRAAQQGNIVMAQAPAYNSAPRIDHAPAAAANESELARAAG